ncbi:hypothetical protein FACS1894190_07080 [Spirochaetia bacterium]|nr:hypothetical protein FACS1894190_07080 [Spirochaetia bacterium]
MLIKKGFFVRGRLKTILIMFVLFALQAAAVFAQELVPGSLTTLAEQVQGIFTGDLTRIIVGCCFAGSCVAYAFNKDNEKMKGKMVAIIIATALLGSAQFVVKNLLAATSK